MALVACESSFRPDAVSHAGAQGLLGKCYFFGDGVQKDCAQAYAWFNLAVSYMQLKRFNDALRTLKKTIELRPNYAVAYYNLAVVYMNLHDNYSARDVYKQLTKIDPAWAKKLRKI